MMGMQLDKNSNAKFLFIGGAPRSGTTLLVNLLDSHPGLLIFPFEHATIERYFWNKDHIQEYALNDFIFNRKEGQQTIPANKELLNQYYQKIKKEYNKDFLLDINSNSFAEAYIKYIKNHEVNLKEILTALVEGLVHSNSFVQSKYLGIKYFVFKQPYYTDLFAQEVKKIIPDAKFIHINRDPFARYASAKKRGVTISKLKNKKLAPINRVNFVEAHSEVDISSYFLAQENWKKLGCNYKIVSYEKMLQDSSEFFRDIFSWLSVDQSQCYLKPTLLGKAAFAGSTFVQKEGTDKTATDRKLEYLQLTSWNERVLHKYYLTKGELLKLIF